MIYVAAHRWLVSLRLLSFHQTSRLFSCPCSFVAGAVDGCVCVGGVEDILHTGSVRYYNLCYKEPPANGLGDGPDGGVLRDLVDWNVVQFRFGNIHHLVANINVYMTNTPNGNTYNDSI